MIVWICRVINDENSQDKMSLMGNAEAMDAEASQVKRLGKCRSRTSKAEYPPDFSGADIDADQNGQGTSTSREEKVSSLKTVSNFLPR